MSRCTWRICRVLLCGLLGCCLAATTVAVASPRPDDKPKAAGTSPEHDQMMAEMMKYATPGPNHELLKTLAGSWKTVTKAWFAPGEPTVTEGTAEKSMILGGRFLKEDFNGTFMDQPFHGFGLTGYDTMKNEFVGTWIDTMGTGIMLTQGKTDSAGKEFTWSGTYPDPVTKQDKTLRMVTKIIDNNNHTFAMYENMEGKEVLGMEITYTRR